MDKELQLLVLLVCLIQKCMKSPVRKEFARVFSQGLGIILAYQASLHQWYKENWLTLMQMLRSKHRNL